MLWHLIQVTSGSTHSPLLAPDIAAVSWEKGRREDPDEKRGSEMQEYPSAHLPIVTSVPGTRVL